MGVLWQRWLLLLLAQAAAGSLGGWLAGWPGALVAVLVGSWLWLWADCWQAHKLRRWLQSGSVANLPPLRGLWAVLGASARTRTRVEVATLGSRAGAIGAALLATVVSERGSTPG